MNETRLTNQELAELRRTISEKTSTIDAQIAKLNAQKDSLTAVLNKVSHSTLGLEVVPQKGNGSDSILTNLVQVYQSIGDWVASGKARARYKMLIGKEIPVSTLQGYLRKNEGKLFERTGKKRFTQWRLIKDAAIG